MLTLAQAATTAPAGETIAPIFLWAILFLAVGMLLWDTIEVGRNDAANIVNAVFGARIMSRERAVLLAGAGVILGATLSSGVMDTARKGIFNPEVFTLYQQVLVIYVSVYIVDTILLYGYSAFGMPVSTTMTLVFELLGASYFLGLVTGVEPVRWTSAGGVVNGIIWSIILSAVIGFVLMKIARWAIGKDSTDLNRLRRHGTWIGGGLLAALTYFMVVKGMKAVPAVGDFKKWIHEAGMVDLSALGLSEQAALGEFGFFLGAWLIWSILVRVYLEIGKERSARRLFPILTVIGMVAMAFAFGQNDLANCAAPGLAAVKLRGAYLEGLPLDSTNEMKLQTWALFGCGVLLVLGMSTKHAQRVTRAEVNTGSAGSVVRIWSPRWCLALARILLAVTGHREQKHPPLAPRLMTLEGKTMHYDPLRGALIMSVAASVIATASALKLPVSTTYVAFAAVLSTGAADRIFAAGDASQKLGRFIWVVFSWFMAAVIASLAAGLVAVTIYKAEELLGLGVVAVLGFLGLNFFIRMTVKKRSDQQESRMKAETAARRGSDHAEDDDDE